MPTSRCTQSEHWLLAQLREKVAKSPGSQALSSVLGYSTPNSPFIQQRHQYASRGNGLAPRLGWIQLRVLTHTKSQTTPARAILGGYTDTSAMIPYCIDKRAAKARVPISQPGLQVPKPGIEMRNEVQTHLGIGVPVAAAPNHGRCVRTRMAILQYSTVCWAHQVAKHILAC